MDPVGFQLWDSLLAIWSFEKPIDVSNVGVKGALNCEWNSKFYPIQSIFNTYV